MSTENPLRTLLIDCRIALRRAGTGDQGIALGTRIDTLIREIDRGQLAAATPAADDSHSGKIGSQQVALAWQTACRGLMLSQPQLYSELRNKVMALLDERQLRDPDEELVTAENEIHRLKDELSTLRGRLNEILARAGAAQNALTVLREALQEAAADMPGADSFRDPQALALARVEWLHQCLSAPSRVAVNGAAPAAEDGPIPGEDVLRAVAAGHRSFSTAQREWVIGEALGLTGWSMTPVELLDKGDVWLAAKILGGPKPG